MADFEINYDCKNGRCVAIAIDDDTYAVTAYNADRKKIGSLEFAEIEYETGPCLKLVWGYLDELGDEYKRQGIGRQCIKLVKERYGLPIVAEDNDGIEKSDGSHLTGDAPAFIAQMRCEGLITPLQYQENESRDAEDE
jgi:hypothetical protein